MVLVTSSSCSMVRTDVVPEVLEVAVSAWVEVRPWLSAAVVHWVAWVLPVWVYVMLLYVVEPWVSASVWISVL